MADSLASVASILIPQSGIPWPRIRTFLVLQERLLVYQWALTIIAQGYELRDLACEPCCNMDVSRLISAHALCRRHGDFIKVLRFTTLLVWMKTSEHIYRIWDCACGNVWALFRIRFLVYGVIWTQWQEDEFHTHQIHRLGNSNFKFESRCPTT